MKVLILTLGLMISAFGVQANPNDRGVSTVVEASFQSDFKGATAVEWKQTGTYYKASFEMNGQHVAAYYDANAKLIAVTRNISSLQLPVTLQAKLKAQYDEHWISELFELSNEDGTAYYVTVEDNDSKITLKSNSTNGWEVFSKSRKS